MAGEGSRKKLKKMNYSSSASSSEEVEDVREKLIYTNNLSSAKTNTVATTILLDDARNGFKKGNFVCSPISLEILLGMLAAGAEGETLNQLLDFLGHETIDQLLYESPSSKLLSRLLSNPAESLDISLANGVWVDKKLNPVQSCYEEVLKSVYKTEARFVDFENKPDESAREINSWVNKKTRGLIPTIVDGNDLEGVVIALANALYFKGLWSDPFYAKNTKQKKFRLVNGKTVSVPFMTSYKEFHFGSFEGYKILQIPYECKGHSNKFSMYIFLPDAKDGLEELLQVFHSDPALFHTRFNLRLQLLDEIWIPKFKMSYKFEAKDVLIPMGLTLPFEPRNHELSQIVEPRVPKDALYVSKILQKSFIEIDETGTEAAATSFLRMRILACAAQRSPPPPKPRFVADHPFMFMIREDTSQAVFFVGVVLNPRLHS